MPCCNKPHATFAWSPHVCNSACSLVLPCCTQVVELPREPPGPVLRFFSQVPNLRVLIMGGDGTVGWVLQCIDELAASMPQPPTSAQIEGDHSMHGSEGSGRAARAIAAAVGAAAAGRGSAGGVHTRHRSVSSSPPQSPLPGLATFSGGRGWTPPPVAVLPMGTGAMLYKVWGELHEGIMSSSP